MRKADPESMLRQLSAEELDYVSGGMIWNRNQANPDVIDARGGSVRVFGWIVTLDVNGNISSVS
jgi:hypothetical protein